MIMFSEKFRPTVLIIGSHDDDNELGAAGFISRLVSTCNANVHFCVMTGKQLDSTLQLDPRNRESIESGKILLNISSEEEIYSHFH